jgi:hypothetical protein
MRLFSLGVAMLLAADGGSPTSVRTDPFEKMKALVGEWQADLPGFGKITSSIRLVSNGTALEETLGTPADNEISIYTPSDSRVLLTHVCAMTPDGHVVRLRTLQLGTDPRVLEFLPVDSSNLHKPEAPHMRRVVIAFIDRDHFSEEWTKTEGRKDTVFELKFVRR